MSTPVTSPARRAGLATLCLVSLLLALVAPTAATAAPVLPAPAPATPTPAYAETTLLPDGLETSRVTRPVAPGLSLTSFDRYGEDGWVRADALAADLAGELRVDYLHPGAVADTAPVREQAQAAGVVAAVNGDFFDINNSGAARGVGVRDGELIQSPVDGHRQAVSITADGVGAVVEAYFDGTATGPDGDAIELTQFNNLIQPGGVGLFTALWGDYPRDRAVAGAAEVTEVLLVDGVVAEVHAEAGSGAVPAGAAVLLGREAGAQQLLTLSVGDPVTVAYQARAGDDQDPATAIGGRTVLVRDGEPQPAGDTPEPRTAVGFSADGQTMYLVTVDGRQVDSRGASLTELGELLAELGAHDALELDGGGSSTLVARRPGETALQVENSPSDGAERPVPNGLALYAPAGSGELTGFWVSTTLDAAVAPGLAPVPGGHPDRVFPGLGRSLRAAGHDETYGPAAGEPEWTVTPPALGSVEGDVFVAADSGAATVTASAGEASGSIELTVLGPLERIAATERQLGLDLAGTGSFGVVGADADGWTAPIEPAEVSLSYDPELVTVTDAGTGWFTVSAVADGAGLITATVGGAETVIPVTVGLDEVVVADFGDADQWWYDAVPADVPGEVTPAAGRDGPGLRLSADFSQHTVTRAAYANPPERIEVPGQPLAFTMGIYGDGNGEWPSLHLVDADGSDVILRGPNVTWTGWEEVRFEVPPGVAYPLTLRRFYAPEIVAGAAYQSELIIDEIVALVPPPVDAPPRPILEDPVIGTGAEVAAAPWRFAVMADAQFTADDPDSDIVEATRRTLRELKAEAPDFLIINGDFVDRAMTEDFELARRILTEELGDELPYYYVPGNHEIMGAPIDNFKEFFGDTYQTFDHHGTRFITLNTATGLLRSEFAQLRLLREALAEAADDPDVGSVAVFGHHPPRDRRPTAPSQLTDRKEAALVEQWLRDFQRSTGKGTLFVGAHTGYFDASRVDGVPFVGHGNSGKDPSTPPGEGGFTGWIMFGVDPAGGADDWVRADVRPHVDALRLAVPPRAPLGEPVPVRATVTQDGIEVPASWPVSVHWHASPGVHVGPESGLEPRHVAWFDPATGELTALSPVGTVVLYATVNGVTAHARVPLAAG